ncbi:MAG: 50S ribosomal protein L24 [Bacilli bacterium]|nr:50S ribosomal protein L24 [Bacilli bacterium]
MKLKQGDKVVVIAGKDKGKEGKIIKTLKAENKVIVEKINIAHKHIKPQGGNNGEIIEIERPIHASNVMIVDPKTKKATRIGHEINKDGKKIRVSRKSNEKLD